MIAAPSVLTFDAINRKAGPYPANLLPHGGTALSLFSAGFLGQNDVVHMERRHMTITCVDVDGDKLLEMLKMYSEPMECHVEDAWSFAGRWANVKRTWDVVSVDPFMGDAAEKAWGTLELWASLANTLVTLTVDPKQPLWAPPGWKSHLFPRSPRASWMVMTRA